MRTYEIMAIISPDVDERQLQPIVDKYGKRLVAEGATVDSVDVWVAVIWPTRSTRRPRATTWSAP